MKSATSFFLFLLIVTGFVLFISTWIYRSAHFEQIEMPVVSLQDAAEIDGRIYIGNGMFKIIQVYDMDARFIETLDTRYAGSYFNIEQDELGKVVAVRDDSRYYIDYPISRTQNYQYKLIKKLPFELNFYASGKDVMIKQSIRNFIWVPLTWILLALVSLIILIIINLFLFMDLMTAKGSMLNKIKMFLRICLTKKNQIETEI